MFRPLHSKKASLGRPNGSEIRGFSRVIRPISTMSKRAVILAGGLGTRLRPFTLTIPKPLVPIGARPVLDIVMQQLAAAGFEHITLAISAHTRLIRAFFGNGEDWNVKIDYSFEDRPLSTMGPLAL